MKAEEQSLKSYVSRTAESDHLMAECKHLIANWKPPDENAWYKRPLHGEWHRGVSEVADMAKTYQWLTQSSIRPNTESLVMAAQQKALNTQAIACDIYHVTQDP